ncbi:MAG: ABC transporter ATP-binding protein [Spirochaetia bacterium]|nr:ABC transporter ATP-binding protein [Spirochaetia bacterium]
MEVRDLSKEFKGEGETVRVLYGLNLTVPDSALVSVEGASGEGKSTLLNILGSIDTASGGQLTICGKDLMTMSHRQKETFRAEDVGLIFQHHYLLPDFTLIENVMMPLLIQRKSQEEAADAARKALEAVGLDHRLDHYPSQISGGEMARAGVARALVGGKKLILADEPTGNLDRNNSNKLADMLWDLQKRFGFTLLIVTHDRELAERVPVRYRLVGGRLESIR